MAHKCMNCGNQFKGNYCNNCGQSAKIQRINGRFIGHQLHDGFFSYVGRGMLHTAIELFRRPGHSMREYMEGKRVKHARPIGLVVALSTVYGLLIQWLDREDFFQDSQFTNTATWSVSDVNHWLATHYFFLVLIVVPFYALTTRMIFRKQGYNLVEYLVLNVYLACQRLILHLILLPLVVFLEKNHANWPIKLYILLIDFALIFWTYFQFFNKIKPWKKLVLIPLFYGLSLILYLLFIGIIVALLWL